MEKSLTHAAISAGLSLGVHKVMKNTSGGMYSSAAKTIMLSQALASYFGSSLVNQVVTTFPKSGEVLGVYAEPVIVGAAQMAALKVLGQLPSNDPIVLAKVAAGSALAEWGATHISQAIEHKA